MYPLEIFEDDGCGWRTRLSHRKVYECFRGSELVATIPAELMIWVIENYLATATLQAALLERFQAGPGTERKPLRKLEGGSIPPTRRASLRAQRRSRRKRP